MIDESLDRFGNDRVGQADYALASGGATVVRELTSTTYDPFSGEREAAAANSEESSGILGSMLRAFGLEFDAGKSSGVAVMRGPQTALDADTTLGHCWPMQGTRGSLGITLSRPIKPTAVTIDHIPRTLALHGDVRSAPRDFEVWANVGQAVGERRLLRGRFDPFAGSEQRGWQTFAVEEGMIDAGLVSTVQLRVLSNHGSEAYTCLYR